MNRQLFWIALAVILFLRLAATLITHPVDILRVDEWVEVELVDKYLSGRWTWADLWFDHSQHRLFFSRCLFLPLVAATRWNTAYEIGFSAFFTLISFLVVSQILRLKSPARPELTAPALAVMAMLFFSFSQHNLWSWGIIFQTPMSLCAAIIGLALLSPDKLSPRLLAGSALAGIVSMFTFSTGIAYWPAAVWLLATSQANDKISRKKVLVLGSAVFLALLWFHQFGPGARLYQPYRTWIQDWNEALPFFFVYLGCPLSLDPKAAIFFGMIGFAALAAGAVFIGKELMRSRADRFFVAIALLALTNAVMTLLFRGKGGVTEVFVVQGALASRYVPTASLFWVALSGLLFPRWLRVILDGSIPRSRKAAIYICMAAFIGSIVSADLAGFRAFRSDYFGSRATAERIRSSGRLEKRDIDALMIGNVQQLPKKVAILKKNRLSVYR